MIIAIIAIWVLGQIVWLYKSLEINKHLSLSIIFQGIFAGIPHLVVVFSEWMSKKYPKFWLNPIYIESETRKDIAFMQSEDERLKLLSNELMEAAKEYKKNHPSVRVSVQKEVTKKTHRRKK